MSAPNTPNMGFKVVKKGRVEGSDGTKYDLQYNKETGDYKLSFGDKVLMTNNVWTNTALEDAKLFENKDSSKPTELLKQLETSIKKEVKDAATPTNGKTHPSVNIEGFTVENTGAESASNPILDVLNLIPVVRDIINTVSNLQYPDPKDYGTDMKSLFLNKPLKYPFDISVQQDRLVITQFSYKSPYNEVFRGTLNAGIFINGVQRQSALRDQIGQVTLPIPNNVSDRNSTNWGNGDTIDTLAVGAASNIFTAGGAAAISEALKGLPNTGGPTGAIINLLRNNPQLLYMFAEKGAVNNPLLRAAIESLIVRAVGFTDVTPETILSRGHGIIPNSNLELLFSGPTLRGFSFGYLMTPRSKPEAEMCRNIIRFFKQGMAPKKKQTSSTGYGEASFFLATPNVFKLQYKTLDDKNQDSLIKGLNRFKICALTDMSVNYAQDQWMAYEQGQPARMVMNLSFKELEPVYESDYQSSQSNTLVGGDRKVYLDQDPVNPDEVGY